MTQIFISYRREDSVGHAGWLHDRLALAFSHNDVFIDFHTIKPGENFTEKIRVEVQKADVVLAVIGKTWLTLADGDGRRRLDDPDDFVRLEISSAINNNTIVIPVLVNGATMPSVRALPQELAKLASLNAIKISNEHFAQDISKLVVAIKETLSSRFKLPMLEWCHVPAGNTIINQQINHIPTFRISKYPVTYSQYEIFVGDDGYSNQDYWTEKGWKWKANRLHPDRYWDNRIWHLGDHPVIGITWYEALAFCRWLSIKKNESIILPTEWQWQRAAQGDDKREYPWGDLFDMGFCNTQESVIGGTTAVDKYSQGVSPFGVYDMAGNTFEWCLNEYEILWNFDLSNNDAKSLRGGSWRTPAAQAKISFRHRGLPTDRTFSVGFRLVMT